MAAISVPSREACLGTFSVNRADGRFVFCLFVFSESTCLRHVSNGKIVKKNINLATPVDLVEDTLVRVFYKMGKSPAYIQYMQYKKAELDTYS